MLDEIVIQRGAVTIADGDPNGAGVVEEILVNGQAMLDMAMFLDAIGPVFYDRTTRSLELKFTIFTAKTTRAQALDAHLRASGNLGVADLTIQLTDDDVTYVWKATGAGWNPIAPQLFGFSGLVGLQVICGEFAAPAILDGDELLGDLDGGNDNAGAAQIDDWDCLSETDDDGAVVETIDGLADAA